MVLSSRLAQRLRSARTWIAFAVLAPVGMLVVSALMLLDLRRDAWMQAEQTSRNLLQVIERDIERNVEIIDLTLRAVVDNLKAPGVAQASPELRQLILFDRAATARDLGVMLVLDENGDSVIDAAGWPARRLNNADREYFQAHKADPSLGLHIRKPLVSRLTGSRIVVLSRRIDKPDGSFGGIVLGSLKLSYFTRLFDQIGLGRDGAINLYLRDGTRLVRHPHADADIGVNIAGTANFDRFLRERSGGFKGTAVRERVERHYAFTQVGDLPLVLNVALATGEIEAEWRVKAVVISAIVLALCGLTILLSLLFGRELRRGAAMQADLARLSQTDALTGLPNRRRFDEAFERAWEDSRRTGKPLSMLVVDADHFKRWNDLHGHAVGDQVLKGLGRCLSAGVHRPADLVARVGGEEFVVLLPDTDEAGALRIAGKVHEAVASLSVPSAGIGAGAVTVSVGVASGAAAEGTTRGDLYREADAALYAAKEAGRNRTRCAGRTDGRGTPAPFRLAGIRSTRSWGHTGARRMARQAGSRPSALPAAQSKAARDPGHDGKPDVRASGARTGRFIRLGPSAHRRPSRTVRAQHVQGSGPELSRPLGRRPAFSTGSRWREIPLTRFTPRRRGEPLRHGLGRAPARRPRAARPTRGPPGRRARAGRT